MEYAKTPNQSIYVRVASPDNLVFRPRRARPIEVPKIGIPRVNQYNLVGIFGRLYYN